MTKDIDWTPDKLDRLRELYLGKDNLSYKFIAEQMTKEFEAVFSRSCISGKLSRMRMPLRGQRERVAMPPVKRLRKATRLPPTYLPPRRDEKGKDLHFIELEHGDCKWPSGVAAPYTFCGNPVNGDGAAYCQKHANIAYQKPKRTWE